MKIHPKKNYNNNVILNIHLVNQNILFDEYESSK
jgi:hypothetical protein